MASRRHLVRLYYAYRTSTSNGFYLPVGVLFLTEVREFSLQTVGAIMAACLLAMLVAAALDVVGGTIAESTGTVRFLAGAGVAAAGVASLLWLAVSPVRDPASGATDRVANDEATGTSAMD